MPKADKPIVEVKQCSKCKLNLPPSQFYSDKRTPDGRKCWCKVCFGASRDKYKRDHSDELRVKNKAYRRRTGAHIYEQAMEYRRKNKARFAGWRRERDLRRPEVWKANSAISNGVQAGKIVKPNVCSSCRKVVPVEGHHDDYGKPLVVRWLCLVCHMAVHGKKPRLPAVLTIEPKKARKRAQAK